MATKKKPTKKTPAKAGAMERMKKVPREVGPAWELSEQEKTRFISVYGLNRVFEQIHPKVHQDDKELLFNGLAAAISFHELTKVIDSLYWDDANDDLRSELEMVRVGFELALQAFDKALDERGIDSDWRRLGGINRAANDPKSQAMLAIKDEWEKRGRIGGKFASEMARKYQLQDLDITEGGIKNAISRWRKGNSPS